MQKKNTQKKSTYTNEPRFSSLGSLRLLGFLLGLKALDLILFVFVYSLKF